MPEMKQKPFASIQLAEDAYSIEDNGVRCLLFIGDTRALLIDTGFGKNGSLKSFVETITDKPVLLVNTHADEDHTGCNFEFGEAYMHPAEFAFYHVSHPNASVKPLWEGDVIDIGTRSFEVIHIPGHTPGSIALFDRKNRVMVAGDSVAYIPVFMFTAERSLEAHMASMLKLEKLSDQIDVIYPGHGEINVKPAQIRALYEAGEKILAGEVEGEEPPFPMPAKMYSYNGAKFFYNPK